jgi:hypothetical protein
LFGHSISAFDERRSVVGPLHPCKGRIKALSLPVDSVLLKICSVAKATLAKDATNSKIIGCHSTCKAGICKSINVHIAQLIRNNVPWKALR